METNWNQLIERYLNGELSTEGKTAFEEQLKESTELQKELELHQLTQNLVKRAAIRNMVQQSGKRFQLRKKILHTSVAVLTAAALATAVYFIATNTSRAKPEQPTETVDQTLLEEMDQELAFDHIDPQYFKFTGENDVFLSESGVLLSITDQSFLLNGKPYKGEAVIQWQEAQTAADIVKAGLSTKSGDKLLETQGMFSLNAFTPEGKKLELTGKGVYVQVPVDELKKDMKLFNGVQGKDGNIDWQTPEELERLPKPKSMKNMNLFPPKYEPKLNELLWFTDKAKRDSLYLSFEERMEPVMMDDTNVIPEKQGNSTSKETIYIPENLTDPFKSLYYTDTVPPKKIVHFEYQIENIPETNDVWLIAKGYIVQSWYIQSVYQSRHGASNEIDSLDSSTDFRTFNARRYRVVGNVIETKPVLDKDMISCHQNFVEFKQRITLLTKDEIRIEGKLSFTPYNEIYSLNKTSEYFSISTAQAKTSKNHIPPSKVLAIWDKKFDNTILATQDFEDRMKVIHNTCDERVFDIYAKNLNEPLWKLDEKVVKLGYPEFQQFANQRVGSLKLKDEHQQNLQAFYDKAIKAIRAKGKDATLAALKKEHDWDDDLNKQRSDEVMRKGLRESANLNEEYGFNLRNVYRQLGITVAFQMHGGGTIVNIDKYVWDATVARQSTLITDPLTGKTARITYNPMKLEVKESGKYDKLYVYLFSKEINSYQRLDLENGKLDYNLNGDMNYNAAIIGMNDEGYFFKEISPLKAKDLGQFSLNPISEKEFGKKINALNNRRTDQPMHLDNELKWLFKEQANYKVQKKRRENAEFRATIRPTIYACGSMERAHPSQDFELK